MRFWELASVLRSESACLQQVLRDPRWHQYAAWYAHFDELVAARDRAILDAELPVELCRAALALGSVRFCLAGGWLRKLEGAATDGDAGAFLTALQVFDDFGGKALEEVLEHGSFFVSSCQR